MFSKLFSKYNIITFLIIFFCFSFFFGLHSQTKAIEASEINIVCPFETNQDFVLGDIHEDIRLLQKYLNNNGYTLAATGPGRPGGETNYFGYLTQSALTKFQQSNNIVGANLGTLDLATREYLNCNTTNNEYENKLIKYNNSAKVYKVENNKKRWIVDEPTFNYYKFNWNDIILTQKYFETGKNIEITNNNTQEINTSLDNLDNNKIYTLSGKITGLKGDIILKNNINNDKLTITTLDSSNFTFNKKLSANEDYDISFTNTDKDILKCYLTNNIGTITNNNIDNIEIMCGDIVTLNYNPFTFIPNSLSQYTLTYRAGSNGSLTGSTSQTLSQGENGSAVTAVPNTNYHFTSWSDSSTDNPRTDTNVFGSIDVTANFAIDTYTITFAANSNGSITGTNPQTVDHASSTTAVTAVPTTTYHFTSWNDGNTDNPRTITNVTSTATYTASFAIDSYLVTFLDWNGDTLSTSTVDHGENATAPTTDPTRTGYTFTGWDTAYTNITTTTTITAEYSINTYTVTYNDNTSTGGSVPVDGSSPYNYNSSVTVLGNTGTLVKTGYTFAGWNTEAGGGGTDYAPAATFSITTDTVLYAQWTVTSFACGDDVTFTYNGSPVTYGTVSNPTTGECWLDRNLGASRVALSSTDSDAYGDLFQWGRPADGHQIRTSGTQSGQVATITPGTNTFIIPSTDWSSIDSYGALRSSYLAKTDGTGICPTGFRVPTETEINAERLSWSSNNSAGAFASPLKLTVSGYRFCSSGSLFNVGVDGNYWSSTVDGTNSRNFFFSSSNALMYSDYRAHGYAVRCLKD
jgi:uncharacterized repeat protein (TIGR02543 family)